VSQLLLLAVAFYPDNNRKKKIPDSPIGNTQKGFSFLDNEVSSTHCFYVGSGRDKSNSCLTPLDLSLKSPKQICNERSPTVLSNGFRIFTRPHKNPPSLRDGGGRKAVCSATLFIGHLSPARIDSRPPQSPNLMKTNCRGYPTPLF